MSQAKRIVVTGASSGIGAALVRGLAADGHTVYACARRDARLQDVVRGLPGALARRCDVSRETDVQAFVSWLRAQTERVDALLNCAGSFGAIGPAVGTDSREWLRTLETNLFGTYLMIKHVVPLMSGERPRIVNFSGGGAFDPFPNYSAYAVSKAGVVRLTEILAVELAPRGIAVNALAPGFVATEIHQATLRAEPGLVGEEFFERTRQLLRDGEGAVPVEVPVACVRFLLSDAARELSGKAISASFDPWRHPAFTEWIPELNRSDLFTLRRVNLATLPDGSALRRALEDAARAPEPARTGER